MAQNIKFGDVDIQIPSLDFKKFGGLIPVIIILVLASFSFYTVGANENGVILRLGKYSHTKRILPVKQILNLLLGFVCPTLRL